MHRHEFVHFDCDVKSGVTDTYMHPCRPMVTTISLQVRLSKGYKGVGKGWRRVRLLGKNVVCLGNDYVCMCVCDEIH